MLNANYVFDTVQSINKLVVDAVVADPTTNKLVNELIVAQTQFGKMVVENATNASKYLADSLSSVSK